MRVARIAAALALVLAGCGDDEGPLPAPKPTTPPPPAGAPGAPGAAKNLLVEKPRVEDRVGCPIPDQPTDPKDGKCDPRAPSCPEHLYCLTLAQGSYCEPCPERDGIRHAFRDRDFDPEYNRDPFQSFLTTPGPKEAGPALTRKCPRSDQLVASSYSYADLKLVGIVAQGTQRKVLMVGGREGYIIKRGDCVGKEKAVVKDIGLGYVTLQLDPDEVSIQLNPKQLSVSEPELPSPAPRTTISPAAPPPAVVPRAGAGPAAPAAGGAGPAPGAAAPGAPGSAQVAPGSAQGVAPPVEAPPAAGRSAAAPAAPAAPAPPGATPIAPTPLAPAPVVPTPVRKP